jgi:hypothetical protein
LDLRSLANSLLPQRLLLVQVQFAVKQLRRVEEAEHLLRTMRVS